MIEPGLTIADHWNLFEKHIIPNDAPEIQRREMKRAFYGGAQAILMIQWKIGSPEITEDEGCKIMDSLHRETVQFGLAVSRGES